MKTKNAVFLTNLTALFFLTTGAQDLWAKDVPHQLNAQDQKLNACLRQSEHSPDDARLVAEAWIRDKGGDRAKLCRAYALAAAREDILAAQEFQALAEARTTAQDPHQKKQAAQLFTQSGDAFHKAQDHKSAEAAYSKALKIESQDPEIWYARALTRAAAELYWDAIEDLNQALIIMPDMSEAFRARGQIWLRLGLESKAKSDLLQATTLEPETTLLENEKSSKK